MAYLIRNILLVVFFMSLTVRGLAQFYSPPYFYSTNADGATITLYNGPGNGVNIPDTINGLTVSAIGIRAFYNIKTLTSVTIPNHVMSIGTNAFGLCTNLALATIGTNVTSIADSAFYRCSKLANITIPSNVVSIGVNAFGFCTKITNFAIPSSVTAIQDGAFGNCSSLMTITVDALNPVYSSVDGVLFNHMEKALIFCPLSKTGAFTIPDGITSIRGQAFQYCGGLTSIIVPNTVTNMGNSTFQYCSSLTNAILGTGVGSIGASAFSSCASLVKITFSPSLMSLGDAAFEYCGSLTNFVMPNTVTNTGNGTFQYCTNLVSATISTNVTTIGDGLFWWDSNLRQVTIPNGVITIGSGAFGNGVGITSLTIPDSVTSIGAYAFNACPITTLSIGSSVTNIGPWAFLGCISLTTSVTIPRSVTTIGQSGFSNDWGVPAFFFEGDAPAIGPDAFWNAHSATAYYLPNTSGWTNTFGGLTAMLWNPQAQTTGGSFGVQNNRFGFNITGTTNIPIVVDASTNLATSKWTTLLTCTMTNGSIYFSDPKWTNYTSRFYRIRSP